MSFEQRAVTLSLEGPRDQRRWTVGLRLILAIPHFFWAALLAFVVEFAIVFAWFGALVLGRMPEGLGSFIRRVFQYYARLTGYLYLLTDEYPPFALTPTSQYPVEVEFGEPGPLNRAAVLFRIILVIPAGIVASLVSGGLTVALLVIWLITLITGRMPSSAFEAVAVSERYLTRFYAYFAMLTSRYPGELFGDGPTLNEDVDLGTAGDDVLPAASPRITRIVLSKAAKRLVILFIILGVFTNAGSARNIRFGESDAAKKLSAEHDKLDEAFGQFVVDAQSCAAAGEPSCVRTVNAHLITELRGFQNRLRSLDLPSSAIDEADQADDDVSEMISLLSSMQEISDVATYRTMAAQLGSVASRFDDDFQDLYNAARFG